MTTRIYYLYFRSNFKTPLRSDSLWGTLCWAIRMVYGSETLESILGENGNDEENAFYISSAFPFYELEKKKHIFFPKPILPFPSTEKMPEKNLVEKKLVLRNKKDKDKSKLVGKEHFEYIINKSLIDESEKLPQTNLPEPKVTPALVTHNTIDRIQGSTLTINGDGQLFHTEEYNVVVKYERKSIKKSIKDTGMFFLAKGSEESHKTIEGALRFLQHYGMGGDRSTGKGSFTLDVEGFNLQEPADANAQMTLSLFHPTASEIKSITKSNSTLLNYKLTGRQGKGSFAFNPNKSKKGNPGKNKEKIKNEVMMFEEGSVFPLMDDMEHKGENPVVLQHPAGFNIYHYGHAFMVKLKVL